MVCLKRIDINMYLPKHLYQGNSTCTCDDCKNLKRFVDIYSKKARMIYEQDLFNFFITKAPFIQGDNIVMGNARNFDFTRNDEKEIIKEAVRFLNCNSTSYSDKNDIISVLNKILAYLYDEFNRIIDNPLKYLIGMFTCLEFNVFTTITLILWFKDEKEMDSSEIKDVFVKGLIDSLEINRFTIKSNNVYHELENILSHDKKCFELCIELLAVKLENKELDELINDFNDTFNYGRLLEISRAIHTIHCLKTEYMEGTLNNTSLTFNPDGSISNYSGIDFESFSTNYLKDMKSSKSFQIANNHLNSINSTSKHYIGFDSNELNNLIEKIDETYGGGDEYLVGSITEWKKVLCELSEQTEDEVEKLFNFLVQDRDKSKLYKEESVRKNRALRKCLITINDTIICPVGLLRYALIGITNDLRSGDIANKHIISELQDVYNTINNSFVDHVSLLISTKYKSAKMITNVEIKDIVVGNEIIEIPGEIDLLMLLKNRLFVIECKNLNLKITSKAIANEYGRFKKRNSKAYQIKLDKKVAVIDKNKEKVAKFIDENSQQKIIETIGLFTTSTFTIASLEEDLLYPVITWTNLLDWFESNGYN
ncbi:NERD domain-containing protein [Desulfuribacillus alkaliarsenatis]|uniref:NERD domain-containing protein n=1 Tax=Desulfuribacillus alkaliarsenatis TaxID=766136 RepID=A0A1E5G3X5_9FIRM|nr:NERD domain-containing protein [Desulfuribacillus alkaliarsenatis]OEF97780.1 hypothetical protein BHF68_13910 [Desulfuribacillus alkaliarsenatis]